ncbi:MAG: hypothetical protein KIT21_06260 [Shinella sp.]|nr:hypothetical protein [Shinella sp.]
MRVLCIRPQSRGGKTVARFDAEIMPGVKLYDLKLIRGDRGFRVFGPSIGGGAAATFAPAIADQLVELALGEVARNANRH